MGEVITYLYMGYIGVITHLLYNPSLTSSDIQVAHVYLDLSRYVKFLPFGRFFSGEKAQILHTWKIQVSNVWNAVFWGGSGPRSFGRNLCRSSSPTSKVPSLKKWPEICLRFHVCPKKGITLPETNIAMENPPF